MFRLVSQAGKIAGDLPQVRIAATQNRARPLILSVNDHFIVELNARSTAMRVRSSLLPLLLNEEFPPVLQTAANPV